MGAGAASIWPQGFSPGNLLSGLSNWRGLLPQQIPPQPGGNWPSQSPAASLGNWPGVVPTLTVRPTTQVQTPSGAAMAAQATPGGYLWSLLNGGTANAASPGQPPAAPQYNQPQLPADFIAHHARIFRVAHGMGTQADADVLNATSLAAERAGRTTLQPGPYAGGNALNALTTPQWQPNNANFLAQQVQQQGIY